MTKQVCKRCGETFERLICFALMEMAGARVYPGPLTCVDEKGHDFAVGEEVEKVETYKEKS